MLTCSGCCSKTNTGCAAQTHGLLTVLEPGKHKMKAPADSVSAEGPFLGSQVVASAVSSRQRGEGASGAPFIGTLIPWEGFTSGPHHLLEAPPPNATIDT